MLGRVARQGRTHIKGPALNLPKSLRESLVDDFETFLDGAEPDGEGVASYLIQQLEMWADEANFDDLVNKLEESGALESSLSDFIEEELGSNNELVMTAEEIVGVFEQMCIVEWVDDEEFDGGDNEDETDETSDF